MWCDVQAGTTVKQARILTFRNSIHFLYLFFHSFSRFYSFLYKDLAYTRTRDSLVFFLHFVFIFFFFAFLLVFAVIVCFWKSWISENLSMHSSKQNLQN